MSQIRTALVLSHRPTLRQIGCGALLFGALACGNDPSDAGGAFQPSNEGSVREATPRDGDGYGKGNGNDNSAPREGTPVRSTNCTFTQGYWKNHPHAWPVSEMKLGQTGYTKPQLLAIFHRAVKGNGLVSLSHQLIAARLNIGLGASPAGLEGTFAEADALIGALVVPPIGTDSLPTSATSALNDALTAFNEGKVGPGHCEHGGGPKPMPTTPTPTPPVPAPPTQTVD